MATTIIQDYVLFVNGRILSATESGLEGRATFAESMFIHNGIITAIGPQDELSKTYQCDGVTTYDLGQKTVLPSFIDGHMHLLLTGQALQKLPLVDSRSFEELREKLRSYAKANPDVPRILANGWMQVLTPNGVTAAMLDDIDPRPIFIDALDHHSMWCSSAALAELGIAGMADPEGGKIHRDDQGNPSGLLSENAALSIGWTHLSSVASKEDFKNYMAAALEAYTASGYAGIIEMAMDEIAWDTLIDMYAEHPDLPMRIAAYWLIRPAETEAAHISQVKRAIELSQKFNKESTPKLRIVGIKIIVDGVTESCTAYLSEPYANSQVAAPIWTREQLDPVVKTAVAGGLQIALHAIGDAAVSSAVQTLELNAQPGGRHRIEHLELVSPEDAKRLGELGITASIQPIHADPYLLRDWSRLLNEHQRSRGYAWHGKGAYKMVVVDGQIITGQNPASAHGVGVALATTAIGL
ncbi:hypothetical protein G7Z17_g6487 [Cylindrodendrum hubeiense]|uniref:Amidohydrolase 3 domain-containing protein n=1 Tax=Cylindrodendrum hubeiense TaxID=595255 RepID=A0A9P5LGR7_9HYPO|nr:hypothetical protein G7Z17_g6487 [Cylindrodendrum hubeiense]